MSNSFAAKRKKPLPKPNHSRKKCGKKSAKQAVGRPKGSKNKAKSPSLFSPELQFIQALIKQLLNLIKAILPLTYQVLDGHFGHHHALVMSRQCGLHLISKLRHDAALYFPYAGDYGGGGRPIHYGQKVDYAHLPEGSVEGSIQTAIYQARLLHKHFTQALNVIIMVKINLKTGKSSPVILFSSDLDLAYDLLIDYYSLRFQIEFNLGDAKQ